MIVGIARTSDSLTLPRAFTPARATVVEGAPCMSSLSWLPLYVEEAPLRGRRGAERWRYVRAFLKGETALQAPVRHECGRALCGFVGGVVLARVGSTRLDVRRPTWLALEGR
jgi:hypothetical protein